MSASHQHTSPGGDGDHGHDDDHDRMPAGMPGGWYASVYDEDDGEDEDEEDGDYHPDEEDEYMDADDGGALQVEFVLEPDFDFDGDPDEGAGDDDDDQALLEAEQTISRRILNLLSGGGGGAGTAGNAGGADAGPGFLTQRQLLALLRGHELGRVMFGDDDFVGRRRRRAPPDPNRFPKVPSDAGRELMESGVFGAFDLRDPDPRRKRQLARRILDRELGLGDAAQRKTNRQLMAQQMIPSTKPEMIVHYDDPVCCGQFSNDGNFFYACVKDFKVRMYDTSRPYNWRHYKTVLYQFGQWTLTDANLSPDNKWLACTSLHSNVCLAPTDPKDTGDPYVLDLSDHGRSYSGFGGHYRGGFPIFSIRFSGDGRRLVAGTGAASIVVYDIESRTSLHHVVGHEDDVNAVCFADKMSPHILYSGSDDCTIKVWDTRSLADGREAGVFVGHIEGLTYIDSKGDGRYILSNAKDQSMKLWDLRMAMSATAFREKDPMRHIRHNYDYRWQSYDERKWFPHPDDNSLVTFRGHKVQRTLIRCHFSPPGSTNSRYVYSGSYDGNVHIWNLDATLAAKIDVKSVTENVRPGPPQPRRRYRVHEWGSQEGWQTLVRDVSWHPNAPLLVASAWNGTELEAGTLTLHSYNENDEDEAEPKMGISVDEKMNAVDLPMSEPSSS